ncbi:MAG: hypothetical protein RJA57_533 [Bacteroidota bacterium]
MTLKHVFNAFFLTGSLILLGSALTYAHGQESPLPSADPLPEQAGDSLPPTHPKAGFRQLLYSAMEGDGVTGARLNPMAVTFVERYITQHRKAYMAMKVWGDPYLTLMDQVLTQHGIPVELKYLAVIESGLRADALSPAGALGPWNFMPATARHYGLTVTRYRDERTDFTKSTHAAARMLTDLYARYGDWLLVIAAYNCGEGNVERAIRKSGGSRDFWTLQYHLPNESMNHVKKFIGTHYIFEGEGGITTLTKGETKDLVNQVLQLSNEELQQSTTNKITGRFNSEVIVKYTGIDRALFDRFNPGFDQEIALNGTYQLRLPIRNMNDFIARRYQILEESLNLLLKNPTGTPR